MIVIFFVNVLVLNLAFALSVLGFLIMHVSLVAKNTTTIEVSIGSKILMNPDIYKDKHILLSSGI